METPISTSAFKSFDPLTAKMATSTVAQANAVRKEIQGILYSYHNWFDPFCETIQNALDSVEQRNREGLKNYTPSIWIRIDIKRNLLTVTDNGLGLDEKQFESFLAPYFSFKSGPTRGKKGVGATYLAYGFNYIQVASKSTNYAAIGNMIGARDWVNDLNAAGNPEVVSDPIGPKDPDSLTDLR